MKQLTVLMLLLSGPCFAELDLRPRFYTQFHGGFAHRRAYFVDGERKFAMPAEEDLEIIEADGGALFRFKTISMASVRFRQSPMSAKVPFGGDALKKYEEAALAMLPRDSEEVTVVTRIPDPLPINDWTDYRFVITYRNASGMNCDSITFLNLTPEQQIVIQSAAKLSNFEEVQGRADFIMRRWFEVPPGGEPEGN